VKTIRGKKALITGAASGIGRAIALALAREGSDLFLVDIDESGLRMSARDAAMLGSSKVLLEVCDLSSPTQISACTAACLRAFGELDIVVNAAGLFHFGHVDEMNAEMWKALMSVNLLAPIQLVGELMPALLAQKESHILNVCSIVGLIPARKVMSYQTSKFALVGYSLALRTGYAAYNVGVTALCPGLVDTPMLTRSGPQWLKKSKLRPFGLLTTPEAVARRAIVAIRRNSGIAVVPLTAHFLWLIYRMCPTLVLWLFSQRSKTRSRA
jgi:NAD(P)-dependent dehydrogenase (short-subunit alcohol dehydrogenase family)